MRKLAVILTAIAVAILPAAFLSQAQAAGKYRVTLKASKTGLNLGGTTVFSGKVSPKAKGKTVRIQMLVVSQIGAKSWKTVSTANVKANGTYARTVKPQADITVYRVYKPSGAGRSGGASKSIRVRAYSWYPMVSDELAPTLASGGQYLDQYGPQTVAGTPVTKYWSTTGTAGGKTRWFVHHSCNLLRLSVGLDDRSAEGADAQFRVHADEKKIVSVRVRKGAMTAVDVAVPRDATGNLAFTAEARNNLVPTYVNVSRARAHCAFPVLED